MTLRNILEELDKGHSNDYILLTARYVDPYGWTNDFVYKGCAVVVHSLLSHLPYKILERDLMGWHEFFTEKKYGTNKDGKIVKIICELFIEF